MANLTLVASQAAQGTPTIAARALFGPLGAVLQRLRRLAQSSHLVGARLATIANHPAWQPSRLVKMAVFRPDL